MDLSSLSDSLDNIITDIKEEEDYNVNLYAFNEMEDELLHLQFTIENRDRIINQILQWIEKNPLHTFPKKEKRWMNTIKSQKNLHSYELSFDINEVLSNIKNKSKVPSYLRSIYQKIYKNIQQDNTLFLYNREITIPIYLNPVTIVNSLIENNYLYRDNKRLRMNKSNIYRIKNKRMRYNEYTNLENPNKKLKI